jgi:hypothetical protein
VTISCPSCRTRYRYPQTGAGSSGQACCARCGAEFALAPDRPAYRIIPLAMAAEPSAVPAPPTTLTQPPPELPAVELPPLSAPESSLPESEPHPLDTPAEEAKPAQVASAQPEVEPEPRPARSPRRGGALRDLLLTLMLASAGWGAGYYLSVSRGADLLTWTAAGSGIGLVLSWMGIRWLGSRHDRREAAAAGAE